METWIRSRVPWDMQPGLKEIADEVGVDFDNLINGFKNDKTDYEMAEELGVTEKMVFHLRDHFMRYGIGSVQGQD